MKSLPAGIIEGFEWVKDPKTGRRYGMLEGQRLEIYQVPKHILRPFISEMLDNKEFMQKYHYLSIPDKFNLWIDFHYALCDEIPDLDLTTMQTNKELNVSLILTPRELEVAKLLSEGKQLKSIPDILGIAFNTVKTIHAKIFGKLNIHSNNELFRLV